MGSTAKLAELRAKTDRELLEVIHRELDRGLTLTNVAAHKGSPLYVQADKVYAKVNTLLPTIDGVNPDELARLESQVKELRLALDRVPSSMVCKNSRALSCAV